MSESELTTIERRMWTNDADAYAATYLSDAFLIFPGIGKISRDDAVAAIRSENAEGRHWAEVAFSEWVELPLRDSVLISYLARARWNYEAQASRFLCSTVYTKVDGHWRIALHQQTAL